MFGYKTLLVKIINKVMAIGADGRKCGNGRLDGQLLRSETRHCDLLTVSPLEALRLSNNLYNY